jgi:hypothetical protein
VRRCIKRRAKLSEATDRTRRRRACFVNRNSLEGLLPQQQAVSDGDQYRERHSARERLALFVQSLIVNQGQEE